MRIAIATLAMLVMTATAQADSLFDKTRLDCVLEYGGEWDYSQHPPKLVPLPPKTFTIHSIDLEAQIAESAGGVLAAVRGKRSVVFAMLDTSVAVFTGETIQGFPAITSNMEFQRAGYCH